MVPKMRGTRLNFASKSSVAPVDCQTYCGVAYPSYHTLPNSVFQLTSGCGLRSWNRSTPVAVKTSSASLRGDIDNSAAAPPIVTEPSVRSDVWCRSTTEPSADAVTKLRSRGDIAIAVMALRWGSNSWARTMPYSSLAPIGARNQLLTRPSSVPATYELPPSTHSSAVIFRSPTVEMSVSSGSAPPSQW